MEGWEWRSESGGVRRKGVVVPSQHFLRDMNDNRVRYKFGFVIQARMCSVSCSVSSHNHTLRET